MFAGIIEIRLHYYNCKDLPSRVTDEWCSTMFGGTENCPPGKLIIFFTVLIFEFAVFGYGYIDGVNFALDSNDKEPDYWLNEIANGFMFGFGRIISVNIAVILFLSCTIFCTFTWNAYNKCREKLCKSCIECEKSLFKEVEVTQFYHRCLGYGIVTASFLHLVCVYFTYEDSGSTRSFMDVYGTETFATGIVLLALLAFVTASSNETLFKQNTRLFKQAHYQSIIIVLLLIGHGHNFISSYYWMIVLVPIIFYSCDLFLRYLKKE